MEHLTTEAVKQLLTETIRCYNRKGWSPATSTNYSFKNSAGEIWVSRSGVDKSEFQPNDFISVDAFGTPIGQFIGQKPSAETLIHCVIYTLFPDTKVILHSHSPYVVAQTARCENHIEFEGYEVQKGFSGIATHEETIRIPIFENSQDMIEFSSRIKYRIEELTSYCFVIRKHGSYAWGKNLVEAKRHLESLDYLCQCELYK
jgi:methylthioribulose-1-phosphate dehydratase